MKKTVLSAVSLLLIFIVSGCSKSAGDSIVVGAKDYTEQDVLGNMLTLYLQNATDLTVTYKNEMASNVIFAAAQKGDVDVYVEYTGTVYGSYLEYSEMKSAEEVYDISVNELKEKFNLNMLSPLGFNNTYCLAVRNETAEEYGLVTYSDLAEVSSNFIFGGGFEILNRSDGIPNLKLAYNMSFKDEIAVEGVLRYSSIANDETQVTEAFSTDGMLLEYDLTILEDDLSFFPPYHAAPIIREDTANKHPEVVEALSKLADAISDDVMRQLNYKVDVLKEDPKSVAEGFLKEQGLI